MLKIMENETEIFRAWLKKYVKNDKQLTGLEIAQATGVKPPTVTAWHSGRKNDKGKLYYPRIPFKAIEAIVKLSKIPYKQILEEGRSLLKPKTNNLTGDDIKNIVKDEVLKYIPKTNRQANDFEKHILTKHKNRISDFPEECQNKAYEINDKLIEISKIDPEYLEELDDVLKAKLKRLKKEGPPEHKNGTTGKF